MAELWYTMRRGVSGQAGGTVVVNLEDRIAAPDQTALFTAIPRETSLSARVTAHLEQLIFANRLIPGSRLPSERQLAEQFEVSRTVVREAVRALLAKGLLEVVPGSGTLIRAEPLASASESISLLLSLGIRSGRLDHDKVVEVRRALEVEIAGLAANRATAADLTELAAILHTAESGLGDHETFVRTDVAFHAVLARATHNPLFSVILDSITDVMIEVRRVGSRVQGVPARALAYHREILAAVQRGDEAAARQAMDRHLDEARETMARGLDTVADAAASAATAGPVR